METGRELVKLRNDEGINDLRSSTMQIGDGAFKQGKDLRIGNTRAACLTKHTDPPAHGNVPFQKRTVSRRDLAFRPGGCRVRRVDTSDDVQKLHEIGYGAGHRTGGVPFVIEANHSGPG